MRIPAFIVTTILFTSVALPATPGGPKVDPRVLECSNPPAGVIRFSFPSADGRPVLFEWSGMEIRKVDSKPYGKDFYRQFKEGSTYEWNRWDLNLPSIDRRVAGAKTFLSTPYSMSSDSRLLAAGVQIGNEQNDIAPTHFVVLDVAANVVISNVDVGKSIDALSLAPGSTDVVVVTRVERYGKSTAKERLASAIGHLIPYEDIGLAVFGVDGLLKCSAIAAQSLPYATGRVRWDSN